MFDFIGSAFGYIIFFGYKITGLYVIGLILFTIAVKLVMFPLSIKQQKTTAKQQRLGPKLQELKERYGNDKQKFSQAQMELYQKEGVSPMGGCLPMLLQFPIIIGLYSAVIKPLTCVLHLGGAVINQVRELMGVGATGYYEIEIIHKFSDYAAQLSNANILSSEQVTELDQLSKGAFNLFGLDLLGTPAFTNILIIIPILCFASSMAMSLISSRLAAASGSQPGGGCMKWGMPVFMSIFSTVIAFSVPGAVGVYWILSNLFSIGQSYAMNYFYNAGILTARDEAARIARRRQEESAIISSLPPVDLMKIAQEKKQEDQAQQAQEDVLKPQNNPEKAPRGSGQKVIKTGNAARAGQAAGTKKKKK